MPRTFQSHPLVGLVPAAGQASRLGPLPCSKEVLPIGLDPANDDGPRVACEFVLGAMRKAGIDRVYVVLRPGKWDIPAYLGDGQGIGPPIAYLTMRHPYGVPFTLDQAHPFVQDATIVLGFPDVVHSAEVPVIPHLLDELDRTGADVVLGLFPTDRPGKSDAVQTRDAGRIRRIDVKPQTPSTPTTWITAVWTPTFTSYLHETVARWLSAGADARSEFYMGHVFQEALRAGLDIRGVHPPGGHYIDLGTPDELAKYTRDEWS